jgi:hypothetical protein
VLYAPQTAVDYRERWHALPHTSIVPESIGGDRSLGKVSAVHVVAPYLPALHEISSSHAERIYAAAAQKGEVEPGSYAQQAVAAAAANEGARTVLLQQQQQQQQQQPKCDPQHSAAAIAPTAVDTASITSVHVPSIVEVAPELCSRSIEVPAAVTTAGITSVYVPPIVAPAAATTATSSVTSVYVPPMVEVASEVAAKEAAMRHKIHKEAPSVTIIRGANSSGDSDAPNSGTDAVAGSGCSSS